MRSSMVRWTQSWSSSASRWLFSDGSFLSPPSCVPLLPVLQALPPCALLLSHFVVSCWLLSLGIGDAFGSMRSLRESLASVAGLSTARTLLWRLQSAMWCPDLRQRSHTSSLAWKSSLSAVMRKNLITPHSEALLGVGHLCFLLFFTIFHGCSPGSGTSSLSTELGPSADDFSWARRGLTLSPKVTSANVRSSSSGVFLHILSGASEYDELPVQHNEVIDLPLNKLSGTVPPVFGRMNDLYRLNLEMNQFQASDAEGLGFIDSLVNCSTLSIFSIAYNDLGGSIPQFLEDLKYLSVLDLSYNHFHGELPVKGVFGNSSAVLSVVGNGKRPVDERFKEGMTLRKFVEICASHDRIMEVIDQSMFSQEQEDGDIEHGDILSVRKKIECLVSVVALGLACSVESPNERLCMSDVAVQMHAVRDKFLEFGLHGVMQEVH
ncbi:hypothetical protein J5N97_006329 [Dioscorea zingiberensis]|uniref:Uncharacterized protein n=1 Tax=Dioscorea zingiberensis TaxID=325984 RepID=A0A9D5D9Z3_9LILI|nr:hypothetical protein J5N97_006329 [Dioscorea zingiberensis]